MLVGVSDGECGQKGHAPGSPGVRIDLAQLWQILFCKASDAVRAREFGEAQLEMLAAAPVTAFVGGFLLR